ncbi:MAG: DUF4350 domain-containing protein [Pseudomonadota bacterium]
MMKSFSYRHSIYALLLLAFIGIGYIGYRYIEFYEVETSTGYGDKALSNPYLAAGRLMEKFGATVHFLPMYIDLPPERTTLFLPTSRYSLTQEHSDALLQWVQRGGHLLIVASSLSLAKNRKPDRLLDHLGVQLFVNTSVTPTATSSKPPVTVSLSKLPLTPIKQQPSTHPALPSASLPSATTEPITLPDNHALEVAFNTQYYLEDAHKQAQWALKDSNGIHALAYRIGKGTLTALSDHRFSKHYVIEQGDHAALTYYLLSSSPEITWIYGEDIPSLWVWIFHYGWMIIISLGVVLCSWIWSVNTRFGPLMPPSNHVNRRSMQEHITKSGQFLWQHGSGITLYRAALKAFLRDITLRYPHWHAFSPADLATNIAIETQSDVAVILKLMNPDLNRTEENFTRDIQHLDALRTSL